MYLAPALIGLFWGAPLIARELETGTYRLAWNQSVTRSRWTLAKLGIGGLASVAVAGLLSLMITWWASPINTALNYGGIGLVTAQQPDGTAAVRRSRRCPAWLRRVRVHPRGDARRPATPHHSRPWP